MPKFSFTPRRSIFLLWAFCDALCIYWGYQFFFGQNPIWPPTLDEFFGVLPRKSSFFIGAISGWILSMSLILTCIMFLLGRQFAKYLYYIQVPLRLLFLFPSVPLFIFATEVVAPLSNWALLIITATVEYAKFRSLSDKNCKSIASAI